MISEQWYSPGSITFTESQIVFILRNLEIMKAGLWPKNPYENSSYTDLGIQRKRRFKPPYIERIIDITASVELYCDELKKDGDILRTRFSEGYKEDHSSDRLSLVLGMSTEEVRMRIKNALKYISQRCKGRGYG